ncbi:MAG: RNA polymerase sigma factor [Myxococcales bacterium]|nr:RNA polymerase sigma factor [Myxococcales bacterium]
MAAHAAGDETAFRTLFDRHAPGLLRAVQRRVQSEDDARDVVQQTLLNLHRARNDFNPQRKLKPWLYAIAMNVTREHYRKRYRRNEWSLDAIPKGAPPVDPHDPIADMQVAETVREAMKSLLDNQREVIELRWFQDKSYEEISELVGASVAAVRVRAHRGYERLRGELALAG